MLGDKTGGRHLSDMDTTENVETVAVRDTGVG